MEDIIFLKAHRLRLWVVHNQTRTITMNYENVFNMIHQREFHKLDEWKEFVAILKELPYIKELLEE